MPAERIQSAVRVFLAVIQGVEDFLDVISLLVVALSGKETGILIPVIGVAGGEWLNAFRYQNPICCNLAKAVDAVAVTVSDLINQVQPSQNLIHGQASQNRNQAVEVEHSAMPSTKGMRRVLVPLICDQSPDLIILRGGCVVVVHEGNFNIAEGDAQFCTG